MQWSASVDGYCERTSAAFWAEPLNAVSNAAFLFAAVAVALLLIRSGRRDRAGWLLAALIAMIGAGSFLFHTFATRWAGLADVIPIAAFIHVYLYLAMRRLIGLARPGAALAALLFFAGTTLVQTVVPAGTLNGSIGYLPALAAIAATGGLLLARGQAAGITLLGIGAIFLVSLTARTFDAAVCPAFPAGLHFLWHGLNAVVLFLLVRILLLREAPRRGSAPTAARAP